MSKTEQAALILDPANGRPIKYEIVDGLVQYRLLDTLTGQFGPYTTLSPAQSHSLIKFLKQAGDKSQQGLYRENYDLRLDIISLKKEIAELKKRS